MGYTHSLNMSVPHYTEIDVEKIEFICGEKTNASGGSAKYTPVKVKYGERKDVYFRVNGVSMSGLSFKAQPQNPSKIRIAALCGDERGQTHEFSKWLRELYVKQYIPACMSKLNSAQKTLIRADITSIKGCPIFTPMKNNEKTGEDEQSAESRIYFSISDRKGVKTEKDSDGNVTEKPYHIKTKFVGMDKREISHAKIKESDIVADVICSINGGSITDFAVSMRLDLKYVIVKQISAAERNSIANSIIDEEIANDPAKLQLYIDSLNKMHAKLVERKKAEEALNNEELESHQEEDSNEKANIPQGTEDDFDLGSFEDDDI